MQEKITYSAIAKESKTPIKETIKKLNIVYPNSSLGFLHAVYAKVDGKTPNKNGVILAKDVKKDVPKLRFTQANRNHERESGPVLGSILDAWVNEDTQEIEIVFSFFKSLFPSHWEEAQKAIKKGELTVSFELKVEKEDIEIVNGQYRKLNKVDFDGVGLLFPGVKPAYPNAHVLQVASDIINNVFKYNSKQLVCAKAEDAVSTLEKVAILIKKAIDENTIKGESEMDKKTNEALLAKQKALVIEKFGEEAVKDWSDEDFINQDKIDALELSLKPVEETVAEDKSTEASEDEASKSDVSESSDEPIEEPKAEEKAEEVVEEPKAEEVVEEPKAEEKAEEVIEEPKAEEKAEEVVEEPKAEEKAEEVIEEPKAEEKAEEVVEEPKAEEKAEESYKCECIKCGYVIDSKEHCKEIKCSKCGGEMRRENRPGSGNKASEETAEVIKVEEEKVQKITQQYDTETQEESVKVESETVTKVNDEVKEIRKQLDEVIFKAEELEKQVAEKDKEIAFLKENAKKIVEIRSELNEFAKDLSDEDLMDNDKLEKARLQKRVFELENKDVEIANEEEPVNEDLKTGHDDVPQVEEETADERVRNYLKEKYGK